MKNTLTFTEQDFVQAGRLAFWPVSFFKKVCLAIFVLIALFFIYCLFRSSSSGESNIPALLQSVAVLALYLCFLYYWLVHYTVKKQFRQNKQLSLPHEVELTGESFRVSASYGRVETKYTDFHKWRHNEEIILLFHSNKLYQIIPVRMFADEAGRRNFLNLLHAKLGKPR